MFVSESLGKKTQSITLVVKPLKEKTTKTEKIKAHP